MIGEWRILDNKNLSGDSLALRRIRISSNKYEINKAILTYSQLLKKHKSGDRYIDRTGMCFIYKKTTYVPLVYRKIINVLYLDGYGLAAYVEDLDSPVPLPAGTDIEGYLGLLEYMGGFLLYELSNEYKPTTRKMI